MAESDKAKELKKKLPMPTANALLAAAFEIGKECAGENIAYARCKDEDTHIDHCTKEGDRVHNCVHKVLIDVFAKCPSEYLAYKQCLDDDPLVGVKHWNCRGNREEFQACYNPDQELAPVAAAASSEKATSKK